MVTDHEMRMEAVRLSEENERMLDLLRNIAGLCDGNFEFRKHPILVQAVHEWRNEARRLLKLHEIEVGGT